MRGVWHLLCDSLVLIGVVLPWLLWSSPHKHNITSAGFGQLQMGMTEREVERILGVPAGDYGPGKGEIVDYGEFTITSHSVRTDPRGKKWLAGSVAITVCFDERGRVRGLGTDKVYRPYNSPLEMVGQQLGLCKKKPYPPGSFNDPFRRK